MMQTPFASILCVLLALAFLLTPVAAMAYGEAATDTDIVSATSRNALRSPAGCFRRVI